MIRPSWLAAAPPWLRPLLVAGAGAAAVFAWLSGDPAWTAAGGALLVAGLLAVLAWRARPRPGDVRADPLIHVAGRRALSRDAAVAIIHAGGRELLVGYGPEGPRLLADLGATAERGSP